MTLCTYTLLYFVQVCKNAKYQILEAISSAGFYNLEDI